MRRNRRRNVAMLAAVAVAVSGCGADSSETSSSSSTDATTTAPTTTQPATTEPTTSESATTTTTATATTTSTMIPTATTTTSTTTTTTSTSTTSTSTSTTTTTTTTTLPGEPFDPMFAPAGAVLDLAGVAFDETRSVHSVPGDDQPVVASLPPLTRGIVSTGRARLLEVGDGGIWKEVTVDGVTGWVVSNGLVYLGAPRDVTADVAPPNGGTPTAASMLDLGRIVTDAVVPSDPSSLPRIVVAAAPAAGATSEVIYDAFPGELFGDDAAVGIRLVVTGRQTAGQPAAYELVDVMSIALCSRGLTDDGFCV